MAKNSTEERFGGWIQTYTGEQFYPLDPRIEDISINDIATSLPYDMPESVKYADAAILADEKAALMGPEPASWDLPYEPLGVTIHCWSPIEAGTAFLHRFRQLIS